MRLERSGLLLELDRVSVDCKDDRQKIAELEKSKAKVVAEDNRWSLVFE